MTEPKVKITLLVTECAMCGHRSPFNHLVLGAEGSYCKSHAEIAKWHVQRFQFRHLAACMDDGIIRLPAPLWSPVKMRQNRSAERLSLEH